MADKKELESNNPELREKRAGANAVDDQRGRGCVAQRQSVGKDKRRRSCNFDADSLDGDAPSEYQAGETSVTKELDRAKLVRDRQNEERERKLEELHQHAIAAQRYREQREEERNHRMEELRSRYNARRNKVEERRRQLWEEVQQKREALLRKHEERKARLETKAKNERSQLCFAFGSSTPRMLEPADTGGASYWGRRATSTSNVMMFSAAQPLTRRSSERELDGSKKRATSAGGIEKKPGEGDVESDGIVGTQCTVVPRANRRRTDLIPTIPSPREPPSTLGPFSTSTSGRSSSASKSFGRSPGRTCSMSRLDQLAQPRRRSQPATTTTTEQLGPLNEKSHHNNNNNHHHNHQNHHQSRYSQKSSKGNLSVSSMSRSMSHLAASSGGHLRQPLLKRDDNSRSMGTLPGSSARVRTLARTAPKTRETRSAPHARHSQPQSSQAGARSGEVTPNASSRPQSAMSQQSGTSNIVSSTINLRPRTGVSRRPRPASIAGTGVTTSYAITNDRNDGVKTPRESKPPLPKPHVIGLSNLSNRKSNQGVLQSARSARASPRITPRGTPLQSPVIEQQSIRQPIPESNQENVLDEVQNNSVNENLVLQSNVAVEPTVTELKKDEKTQVESLDSDTLVKVCKENDNLVKEIHVQDVVHKSIVEEDNKEEKLEKSNNEENKDDSEVLEEIDMTASMIQKIRITTEEEAKAALAERRRLAREQAEREAEFERQRLEEEARLEAERLRAEEEEQRRLEEETLRLAQEAKEAEERRLKLAIEEAKKREEEDRQRREEEARQKQEKEEAERKAREEAERQRLEMVERLKKEEEERNARRKRVEAIMSRTRAKNQGTTPKEENSEGESSKEVSPNEETKSGPVDLRKESNLITTSQQFITGEQLGHKAENGTHENGILETKGTIGEELNGHHGKVLEGQKLAVDNATVKQNNVTNNLLDLSDFGTTNSNTSQQILLVTEDNRNLNLNPTAIPFTPMLPINVNNASNFQDSFANSKPQDNQLPDLLS